LILLHGRGARAEDILSLSVNLDFPQLAYLAPQAEGYTWYPDRFIAPLEQNEPYLFAGLSKIDEIAKDLEAHHIPAEKIFIGGFSQGACLASEYVIRNPRRYGGVLVFAAVILVRWAFSVSRKGISMQCPPFWAALMRIHMFPSSV
jgi:predicted esterase